MAIALTGTGGLFVRLGKIIKICRMWNGTRGATAINTAALWGASGPTIIDSATAFGELYDQYEASNTATALISGAPAQLTAFQSGFDQHIASMQALAQATLIAMADADTRLSQPTLANAMALLVSQMTSASKYVLGNTVTQPVTAGSNVGDAVLKTSSIDHNGVQLQYCFPETITVTVSNVDTAGNETLSATGMAVADNQYDYLGNWPKGSGISDATFSVADFSEDNAAGNLLTNSGFETFTTANLPDNWTRNTGIVGTDILRGTTALSGTYSLAFVGDGATLISLSQVFDNGTTGTAGALEAPPLGPQTGTVTTGVYALSCWVYVDVVPAAGVLKIDLVDATPTVIADNAGTDNSVTCTVSGLSATTWTHVTAFFRLPTTLPSSISIRAHLTTAMTAGSILYIDDMCLTPATQLYVGGPYLAAFRKTTDLRITDTWTIAVANNMTTLGGGGIFTEWFERFFGMRAQLGMTLPVSGSTQIAESLVA